MEAQQEAVWGSEERESVTVRPIKQVHAGILHIVKLFSAVRIDHKANVPRRRMNLAQEGIPLTQKWIPSAQEGIPLTQEGTAE